MGTGLLGLLGRGLCVYNVFVGNMFKKSLNVYDTWFGFYSDFKKGTLACHTNMVALNGF